MAEARAQVFLDTASECGAGMSPGSEDAFKRPHYQARLK